MIPSVERLPAQPEILFMGTPDFAVPTLEALIGNGYTVRAVVTQPDRPKGRGKRLSSSPVKVYALEHGLEVLQPEKASDPLFCEIVREKRPDLIILVAFGQILRTRLLEIPPWGVINIHGSLLPAYRGAAWMRGSTRVPFSSRRWCPWGRRRRPVTCTTVSHTWLAN
jgi:methionyl-tRNA formyltransferase